MFLIASTGKAFITEYSGHLFRFIAATYSGKRSSGAAREQTEDVNNPRVHVYSPYHAPSLCEGRKGKQLGSEFLIVDARHTRNDIYSTRGVIVSLFLIKLGLPLADPLAGIVVGLLVAKAGVSIIRESIETLVDRKPTDTIEIKNVVCTIDGVRDCHKIRARGNQNNIFVDLHVLVDPSLSVEKGHVIASSVEYVLKNKISNIVDVVVHIEPLPKVPPD